VRHDKDGLASSARTEDRADKARRRRSGDESRGSTRGRPTRADGRVARRRTARTARRIGDGRDDGPRERREGSDGPRERRGCAAMSRTDEADDAAKRQDGSQGKEKLDRG